MAASKLFFNPPSRLLNICSTKDRVVLNFKHPGIVKKTTWRRLQESACRTLDARILGINYAFSKCSLTKSTSAARGHEDWYIFDDFSNCFSECGYVSPEQSSWQSFLANQPCACWGASNTIEIVAAFYTISCRHSEVVMNSTKTRPYIDLIAAFVRGSFVCETLPSTIRQPWHI